MQALVCRTLRAYAIVADFKIVLVFIIVGWLTGKCCAGHVYFDHASFIMQFVMQIFLSLNLSCKTPT